MPTFVPVLLTCGTGARGDVEAATKRVLSPDEEYGIAVYYAAGIPIKDISARFDISRSGVNRVVKRLGVTVDRGKRTPTKEES